MTIANNIAKPENIICTPPTNFHMNKSIIISVHSMARVYIDGDIFVNVIIVYSVANDNMYHITCITFTCILPSICCMCENA